ncbi:Uu.00g032360.m01.CDS01 [Anthostomella pinea]|uniref:Uu.00g032360.m01.CDS01 n=1 Tax=Anthostomella pinea TaxID=933095 RepID=A0AAI8V8Q0_9PEZI|nr:Uu.00g032360.m01.CDS01 [Anthostomella pinea]
MESGTLRELELKNFHFRNFDGDQDDEHTIWFTSNKLTYLRITGLTQEVGFAIHSAEGMRRVWIPFVILVTNRFRFPVDRHDALPTAKKSLLDRQHVDDHEASLDRIEYRQETETLYGGTSAKAKATIEKHVRRLASKEVSDDDSENVVMGGIPDADQGYEDDDEDLGDEVDEAELIDDDNQAHGRGRNEPRVKKENSPTQHQAGVGRLDHYSGGGRLDHYSSAPFKANPGMVHPYTGYDRREEQESPVARIQVLYGQSNVPSPQVMADPLEAKAYLEGFSLGGRLQEASSIIAPTSTPAKAARTSRASPTWAACCNTSARSMSCGRRQQAAHACRSRSAGQNSNAQNAAAATQLPLDRRRPTKPPPA